MSKHPAWVVKSVNISTNEVVLGARLASDLFAVSEAVRSGLELGAVIVGIPTAPASESKEIAVKATPETLAEMAISSGSTGIHLRWAKGLHCATVRDDAVSHWEDERSALGVMRAWLVEQISGAYKTGFAAGHVAGLDDLSRITAPVGTPLDEVANLRREVERLKAENETLQRREPTLTEMRVALGEKPEGSCLGWPTVRRCHKCADPTPGGPTLCHPCGLKMNEERFVEHGRLKGWQEAIATAEAESTEAVKAMQEADRAAEKATDDAVRYRNEAVGAATVADTLRRAAPKVPA